ncbi:Protein SLOW GREEN 1 like [Actinidia chinensis var. chinensis]|uniref:Protein SLOW GREEN 1 like n=1 Tax=Actinidia chinensis var. chinensis TaxID=1590841 RepID=A0A2R6RKB1_ACTCC|nr:Protein SLOW GREEN 1 like [Actinidia chinensis var. chinensis]
MGSLNTRPVLSLPSEQSNYSEKLEEKRETRKVKKGEEGIYEELLKENPRNVEALNLVLNEKMRKGKTSEALKYVDKLIRIQPDEVEWRLLQALCYQMMGNVSKAKRLFNNILAKKPLLLKALHGTSIEVITVLKETNSTLFIVWHRGVN